MDFELGRIYPRRDTTLSRAGAGINYSHESVHGIVVNFAKNAPYPDERLPRGRILHIGEGKEDFGDQKPVGGNRGMLNMMANGRSIPTYEKVAANQYRFLGHFRVSGQEFGQLQEHNSNWRGYKFTLEPIESAAAQIPSPEELGEFEGDVNPDSAPDRIAAIVSRFKRSKKLVDQVKASQNYTCQYCGDRTIWVTPKGLSYCEAHHVIPLGDDGFDNDSNLVVLCSGCHRQIHYAQDKLIMQKQLKMNLNL